MSYQIPPAVRDQQVKELTKLWGKLFPIDAPSDNTFRGWLSANSYLTVAYGLHETFKKFVGRGGACPRRS